MTPDLFKIINVRNRMYHKFIKLRDENILAEYKKSRNKLASDIKKSKLHYHQNKFLAISNDPKKI